MSDPGQADVDEPSVEFELDGVTVEAPATGSLLEAVRDHLGARSVKDGCSPQGQCGCCTVLVDGAPRVACVTPVARVRGRRVTTVDGLADADRWAEAFCAAGASQCGFCTPGIITRLSTLSPERLTDRASVDRSLLAHLCRCTGWQTIREAAASMGEGAGRHRSVPVAVGDRDRDLDAAARRASIEGGVDQMVGPAVALGRGGFADDGPPSDALVAVRSVDGTWAVGETLTEARERAGKVQGRRTTAPPSWPIEPPPGDWSLTLQTTWVEPAYLEPDASWCAPGGEPSRPLGNGGAFGGKISTDVAATARRLADQHGRPVRVLWSREDVVRFGPKRPPLALGIRADGSGVVRAARPAVVAEIALLSLPPGIEIDWVDHDGPPVSLDLRGALWAEVAAARSIATGSDQVHSPSGASARAWFVDDELHISVLCGDPLDEVVLRSYCLGAAHMALGMVRSESLSLDDAAEPADLTIRSFGVLRSVDTPVMRVSIVPGSGPPVNGSDAVFAAVLAAAWKAAGTPGRWPV